MRFHRTEKISVGNLPQESMSKGDMFLVNSFLCVSPRDFMRFHCTEKISRENLPQESMSKGDMIPVMYGIL